MKMGVQNGGTKRNNKLDVSNTFENSTELLSAIQWGDSNQPELGGNRAYIMRNT